MFKVLKFSCLFSFYSFSVTLLQIWLKKYPCKMLYTENSLRTKTFSRNISCYFKEINVDYSAYLKTSTTGSAKNRQTGQTDRQTDRQDRQTDRTVDTCFALKEYFTLA